MTPIKDVVNFRELGGYEFPDGRHIRKGLLLRGGSLAKVSEETLGILSEEYHLARVFDFRTQGEVIMAPDLPVPGSKFIWLPAMDENTESFAQQTLPHEAYRNLPVYLAENASNPMVQDVANRLYTDMITNEYTQLQYAAFLQSVVNTPSGAVYWHCSQGKDRTGLASTFLLAAMGADRDLIMYDYNLSMDCYRNLYESVASKLKTPQERDAALTFIGVNPKLYQSALDLIDRRWGSLMNFVKGPLCMSDDDCEVLKNRYLY